jgi:hypothetical protein
MHCIFPKLWVGGDTDYEKMKDREGWSFARMCKYGPGGHQQTLGYTTPGAPKGKDYLSVRKGNLLAVNVLDLDDPNMIPFDCFKVALDFIKERLNAGDRVLVACNAGHSRGPSTGLAFLRSIGDMPHNFHMSEKVYRGLDPMYDPGMGVRQVMREHWSELDNLET